MISYNITYNSTAGFGFPWTWSIKEAVESRIKSASRSFTTYKGALEASRSLRSAGVTIQ